MKKELLIILLVSTLMCVTGCKSKEERYLDEKQRLCEEINNEIDSLKWGNFSMIAATGSAQIDTLPQSRAYRVGYVYQSAANKDGFQLFWDEIKKGPLAIATESTNGVEYTLGSNDSTLMKIITSGDWAVSVDTLPRNIFGNIKSEIIAEPRVKELEDSILLSRMCKIDTTKYDFNVLAQGLDRVLESKKYWHILDSRQGYNEFETEWFYLPACKVRCELVVSPFDMSIRGSVSLEGKARSASYEVMPGGWHMTRSDQTYTKEFSVPAGQYFFSVDVQEASWAYRLSAYY